MSDFYTSKASSASKMLRKRGMKLIVTRITKAATDPAAGTVTNNVPQLFYPYGVTARFSRKFIQDGLARADDLLITMEAGVVEPSKDDTITVGSFVMSIIDVNPISPAGTPIVYKVHARV